MTSSIRLLNVTRKGEPLCVVALAGARDDAPVPAHAIVGQMKLAAGGAPDWHSFQKNRTFLDFYTRFMRGELPTKPEMLERARVKPGEYIYVIDARTPTPEGEVPWVDIVGHYQTKTDGTAKSETFEYNEEHLLVRGEGLLSAIFDDERLLKAAQMHGA
jgi:hypothetical protein